MPRCATLTSVIVVLAVAGCGEPDTPLAPRCEYVYSGAFSNGQFDCEYVRGTYSASTDTTIVSLVGGFFDALNVNIEFKGPPKAGVFRHSDAGARGFIAASLGTTAAPNDYVAATAGFSGKLAQGWWTMTVTSMTDSVTATGRVFRLHGRIDAAMPPAGGSGTSLSVQLTF